MTMVGVYFNNPLTKYGFRDGHPFGVDRVDAFWHESLKQGLDKRVATFSAVDCPEIILARFHTSQYINYVKNSSLDGQGFLDEGDTPSFDGVYQAAAAVAGNGLLALQQCMSGLQRRAFIPIAGLHHARPDAAAGFCVFNDIGVVIEALRMEYAVQRIAYIDIDAHHGDGVFYAYETDPQLIFADIHEDGRFLYPGTGSPEETGKDAARGKKMNRVLQPGADDEEFYRLWLDLEDFVRENRPEIILFQAGADSIKDDPLAHLHLTPAAHAHAATRLCQLADEYCDGRIIVMGGGGYKLSNIALTWNAILQAMLDV